MSETNASRYRLAIAALAVLLTAGAPQIQAQEDIVAPEDVFILIQSELIFLDDHDRKVTLEMRGATTRQLLKMIEKQTGLVIVLSGKMPEEKLDVNFRERPAREVLEWLARETGVFYQADPPRRLIVMPPVNRAEAQDEVQG